MNDLDPTPSTHDVDPGELELAVVGMAGRFPGAGDVEQLWANLCDGVESIVRFSADELGAAGAEPALTGHPGFVPAGAPLAGIECFDAAFFGIPPREAALMDPQHRLFLECAWHALEHAGYDPAACPGRVGIYAGAALSTYLLCNLYRGQSLVAAEDGLQLMLGNDKDFMVSRASYKLGLRGPSCVIQTACSTSLVAVHVACQALLGGEADVALAGGVSILLPQGQGYVFQEGSILAPDGRCRAFDAAARGTVVGNGIGLVVLKRLADARADGDTIHAVIKGSAVNNDGDLKISFTAPRLDGQAEVIRAAHLAAGVDPATIGLVEAHGTGTPMGDPIEVAALHQAFGPLPPRSCVLGSLKTNIGHLNTAAGIAGLIKAVLSLEHGVIPPTVGFTRPNPALELERGPFHVNDRRIEWPAGATPRRAGVSSFGIGGTNAHVVLEEAGVSRREPAPELPRLLVLSARSEAALERATDRLADHLARHPELEPSDVAYTLAHGRHAFEHRRALVCERLDDAMVRLRDRDPRALVSGVAEPARGVVFMVPGQGAQYAGMARGIYGSDLAFTEALDRCAELARPELDRDLRDVVLRTGADEELANTGLTQPALFAVEYALARSWQRMGIDPVAMIGHSVGEYVVACVAGVLTLPDAIALVCTRARLMAALPEGAMLSVAAAAAELVPRLPPHVELAADNGPRACVVSGPRAAIDAAERALTAEGTSCRRLRVSHAFHSAMMDPLADALTDVVRRIELRPPAIPYVSNVTGTWITTAQATDPSYWFEHLRRPVRFAAGLGTLVREHRPTLLEVGPGRTLGALARQLPETHTLPVLASLRHPHEDRSDVEHALRTLGQLFVAGHAIDWAAVHPPARRVPLPGYAFEPRRHWVEPAQRSAGSAFRGVEPEPSSPPPTRPAGTGADPRDEHERAIHEIWRELLGIAPLGIHDDFFELGGQSLLASQVCARIGQRFGVHVPVRALFQAPTIARLAAYLADGSAELAREDGAVLLADAELDASIGIEGARPAAADAETVLVTGATGFLGAFLVDALVSRTRARIVCLARGEDPAQATRRLLQHMHGLRLPVEAIAPRLEVVVGDLAAPSLGLRPAAFEELCERIDAIYHAGAWVNFTYPYAALRDANVLGTREIIRLACRGCIKPLHMVSTAAVFASPEYDGGPPILEDAPVRCSTALRGYEQSKWVAEQLVAAARARGLPTTIHRPATVTGHTRTGAANLRDFSLRMLLGCIELGAWPQLELRFSMAPVDHVAAAIVHLSSRPESLGRAFHCTHPHALTMPELVDVVADLGYPLPVLPYAKWRERLVGAVQARPDHPLAPFVPLFGEQHHEPSIAFDCRNVLAGLSDGGPVCPPLDAAMLRATLSYLSETAPALSPSRPPRDASPRK